MSARNAILETTEKQRVHIEKYKKQYYTIKNTGDKLLQSMEDAAMIQQKVPDQDFLNSMKDELK
jgi:hypothetical protein